MSILQLFRRRKASRTALGVAALRAIHQTLDGEPKVLDDPVVARLVRTGRLTGRYLRRAQVLRSHVVLRSRFAEDRLEQAVERGVKQFVILGAGYDSFAYRQPAWARGLRIFEVDQPVTQLDKRRRLQAAGVALPDNLEFVGIDFEQTSLREGLSKSGLDFGQPAFFSCLGVLMYLRAEAVRAVFDLVAEFPAGSEIAFTFSTPAAAKSPLAWRVRLLGEPFRSHFEPRELAAELRGRGYSEVFFLRPEEAQRRYYQDRRDGLNAPRRSGIAAATVG
jgi:methyltransferase (TIGR00027 family)